MHNRKLYNRTSETFRLPLFVNSDHKVTLKRADNIPTLQWPDGRWCTLANIFILKLFEKGLSRSDRGGTLLCYATNISHLLRYCFKNKIELIDLTDNEFCFFITTLCGERKNNNSSKLARGSNAVIAIVRNCLELLDTVSSIYDDPSFIGVNGRIKAEKKVFTVKARGGGLGKNVAYWHHYALPLPSQKSRRFPITSKDVEKLRDAVLPASSSVFQRKRRYIMIKILEITGGRRSEVSAIKISSIEKASKMESPLLEVPTTKRKGGHSTIRMLPIAQHDLLALQTFIKVNRAQVISKTCGHRMDDGILLISESTGRGLRPNTITQELRLLAIAANINNKRSSPHLFRHRFITNYFVRLILEHEFENEDSFRRALLNVEDFKAEVREWTGHSNVESLEPYIHLAFQDLTKFPKTIQLAEAARILESFNALLSQFNNELKTDNDARTSASKLLNLTKACQADVEKLLGTN